MRPRLLSQLLAGRLWLEVQAGGGSALLESSSDLVHWSAVRILGEGEAAAGIEVEDVAMRFYRLRQGTE